MVLKKKETADQKLIKMLEASSGTGVPTRKVVNRASESFDPIDLVKKLNLLLMVGVLVAAGFLVKEVMAGVALASSPVSVSPMATKKKSADEDVLPVQQNVEFYLSAMNRRNIFEAYDAESKSKKSPKVQAVKRRTDDLRLVGVSWFDKVESASAMIEDTQKGITYFLHKGEKIDDITVKTIYADSVELGYKNEEIIIRYDNTQM